MVEQLFGSKTRVKLLGLFYQNPGRAFYVREITRKIDEQINSVRRELANLLSIGIISSDTSNNKLYYEANQNFEHYDALASMFGGVPLKKSSKKKADIAKDGDAGDQVEAADVALEQTPQAPQDESVASLIKAGNVRLLVYTGQFTRDDLAGVDIFMVGDINTSNLENAIALLEKSEKKSLRYSVLTPQEYMYRRQINDRFVSNFLQSKKIVHVDKDNFIE